jgi:hypothetical protein
MRDRRSNLQGQYLGAKANQGLYKVGLVIYVLSFFLVGRAEAGAACCAPTKKNPGRLASFYTVLSGLWWRAGESAGAEDYG